MNANENDFVINYLTYTLIPALHEKRIHIDGDTYRVHVEGGSRAGDFVHISRMCHPDDEWVIVATPGFDGETTSVPVDVHDEGGGTHTNGSVDIHWTGRLEYDVQCYLHALRTHMITHLLPVLIGKTPIIDEEQLCRSIDTLRDVSNNLAEVAGDAHIQHLDRKLVARFSESTKQLADEMHDAIPYLTGTSTEEGNTNAS